MVKFYIFGVTRRTASSSECPTTGVMAAESYYEAVKLIAQRFPESHYRIQALEWIV